MTCEEFREIIASDPRTAMPSEVLAVVRHRGECKECYKWHKAESAKATRELSQEQKDEWHGIAVDVVKKTLARMDDDEELTE